MPDSRQPSSPTRDAQPSEILTIGRHAGTVLVGQVAVMAFGVTDTVVAGRYAAEALAALSVASAIFVSVYVSLMGVLQALLPVWAEQHGRGETAAIGRSFRQSLYLAVAATALGAGVLLMPGPLLQWTDVPVTLQPQVRAYLAIVGLALPGALFFRLYTTLNQSLGHPQLVTWLQLGSLALKVPLSIWFTFGGAGLAPQGAAGCAWATLLVQYTMVALAVLLLRRQRLYRPLQLWQPLERPDTALLRRFLRLGLPAGLAILVEVTSFTLMALFIARQGALSSAGHQIAANLAALCYMVPLSLAISTSARVSFWRGAGDEARARQLAWLGLQAAGGLGLALAATVWLARDAIAAIYSPDPAVVTLASGLLVWVALYHAADCLQTLCIFVLRSYRITVAPLVVYCTLLWGGGLAGGYWLAYKNVATSPGWHTNPAPFWIASAAALALTATIFIVMLRWALRPAPQRTTA